MEVEPRRLQGLPPDLLAWLGPEPSLHTVISFEPSRIDIRGLTLHGAMGEGEAEGSIDPGRRSFDAAWRGQLRDLGGLPVLAPRPWGEPTHPISLTGEIACAGQGAAVTGTVRAEGLRFGQGR